jgi:hypothetical protein
VARRQVWREDRCGEKAGVARRQVWREDRRGEKTGVARRQVWGEDRCGGKTGVASRQVWREDRCGEKTGVARRRQVWREGRCGEKTGVARRQVRYRVWREDASGKGSDTYRCGDATGRTPRARSIPTPINIALLVSTVLRVLIGKATTTTTLISTPRSEDFQSIEASIYANRWPTKLRVCRRRTYRGTCTKFHGAPIHRTPPMRAYSPLDDRYAKRDCLNGS